LPERSAHLVGIGLMLLAMLLFSMNDALGKWLVASYTVAQILVVRSISAALILTPFVVREGLSTFRHVPRPSLQLLRVVLATGDTACFYLAVWYIPLADAMTFYLAGPIYVTAISAVVLKEKVGIYRWSAVSVGFVGVLVALDPSGGSFGTGSLIALGGSICYALLMVVTRQVRETSNTVMSAMQIAGAALLGLILAPFGWSPIQPADLVLLLLLGAVALAAIALVNQSLRVAPASVVVPFQYSLIVWAMAFGYLVFGDVPSLNVFAGAGIIVASGLFIFMRGQRLRTPGADDPALADR
jgi:drug/metabolite transporter (DMT)-like permease